MTTLRVTEVNEVPVKYLRAECGVRYWEDGEVNGVEDEDGSRIPFRVGDTWCPVIELDSGKVEGWPEGITAKTHYKVCDAGRYELLGADRSVVKSVDGYVPRMMSPGGGGYGDYVIMTVGPDGTIENWRVDLDGFED